MRAHNPTDVFRRDPCALTPRENEALQMLAKHGNYRAVADIIGVKPRTLHKRFSTIRQKLGVATNELAIKAVGIGESDGASGSCREATI